MLRVLHRETDGTSRHNFLRAEKERQSSVVPPLVPSHCHADDLLGLHKVLPRRSRNVYRRHQLFRSYRHVLLLHAGGDGPRIPKVLVVEALDHQLANGK